MLNYLKRLMILASFGMSCYLAPPTCQGLSLPPQSADQPQTFKLEGTVVNQATGRPIPRTLVEWFSPGGIISVLTGSEGEFAFTGVPSGRAQFGVHKPGYFSSRGGAMITRPISFNVDADTGKVTIKLIQEAVIFGRVLGKDGEPLEGATIRIERANARQANGRHSMVQVGFHRNSMQTDEDGNFRIAELPPGPYVVSMQAGNNARRVIGSQSTAAGQHSEAYPAVAYYPTNGDEASAEPVHLLAGQHLEINFSIAPRPAYKVAGTVARPGEWKGLSAPMMVDHHGQSVMSVDEFDQQTGAFTFRTVPAGVYTLRLTATDQQDIPTMVQRKLIVNKDMTGLVLSLAAPIEAQVNVRKDFETKATIPGSCSYSSTDGTIHTSDCSDYPPIRMELQPKDFFGDTVYSNWGPEAPRPLMLRGLQPGKYKVRAWPAMVQGYVSSLRCGFVDLLHEDLVVPESGQIPPIEAVLRDDMSTLQATVNAARNTNGMILAVPEPFSENDPVSRIGMNFDNGASLTLAPGAYKVFAIPDSEDINFDDPAELALDETKAVSVNLLPGKSSSILVELIHTGD